MVTMIAQEFYTVGYEGRDIEAFVSYLKDHKITRLIDIREIPLSRKKGFSKTQLKNRIQAENIEYVHVRSLGSPSGIRHQLKEDQDYGQFFSAFANYLSSNMDSIIRVHDYVRTGTSCLMCFERYPDKCHRSVVAKTIKEYDGNGLKIVHI